MPLAVHRYTLLLGHVLQLKASYLALVMKSGIMRGRSAMQNKKRILWGTAIASLVILYLPILDSTSPGFYSLARGLAATLLAGIFGYLVMSKLKVFDTPTSPMGYGKMWFGYLFFIICVTRLSSFASSLDVEYLAQFSILIVVYGAVAFGVGYVYGVIKTK